MKYQYIIGIDEVGRGPLAGPVTVGAVCISADFKRSFFRGIKDSKKLSAKAREMWREKALNFQRKIVRRSLAGQFLYAVSSVAPSVIDKIGINKAIARAMKKSLSVLQKKLGAKESECLVLLDGGLRAPAQYQHQKTIIKGDEKESVIALASIFAKVNRDKKMEKFAIKYPEYGFEKNKGYGTEYHCKKIRKHGPSKIHRKSFIKNI